MYDSIAGNVFGSIVFVFFFERGKKTKVYKGHSLLFFILS